MFTTAEAASPSSRPITVSVTSQTATCGNCCFIPVCSRSAKAAALLCAACASARMSTFCGVTCAPIGRPSTEGNSQLPTVVSALRPGRCRIVPWTRNDTPSTFAV